MDIQAADYLHEEEIKREDERENRDREFWRVMLGAKDSNTISEAGESTLEDSMSRSALGSR